MALQYILAVGMHMAVAKELLTFCLEPHCKCDPVNEDATCSGLDFVPKLPDFVHNLTLADNNFREENLSRQFLSNVTENDLISLTFINNSIPRFTNDVFVDLTSLTSLTISGEIILNVQSLQNAVYGLNTTLKAMKLDENYWHYLPYSIFRSPSLNHITNITLTNNAISNLSLTTFADLHSLQIFNISMNIIMEFSVASIVSIESLILAKNDIVRLPKFCSVSHPNNSYVPKLKNLDLSRNAISFLFPSMFMCLPSLETLRLNSNRFNTLCNYLFSGVPNLQVLFIQHNPEIKTIEQFAFTIPSLKKLHFGYNNFRFDKSGRKSRFDPYNIFKHLPRLQHLDLTNNYLPTNNNSLSLMFQNLSNLENLILQAANIHGLHWYVFQPLTSLQKLILQGNFIECWPDGTFDGLTSLQYLNLQDNRIHLLNKTSISANVLNGLQILDLSGNPFTCTCDLIWFREWIKTTNTSLSSNFPAKYRCTYPIIMQGQRLIDYNPTKKSCTEWNPLFTMAIIISTFGFLVLVVIFTVFKCHANIRNYFYLLRLRRLRKKGYLRLDNSQDFEFHAFVVYCDDDRLWVHNVFVKRLEEKGIKLCIHHREFDPGIPITENIDKYMNKSWKVVVIMSNSFASSEWCQWEVDVVQERMRRQGKGASVLIMLKAIDADHMTSAIRTLLHTTPYLRYRKGIGEELFWQAVANTLRKPLSVPPMAI